MSKSPFSKLDPFSKDRNDQARMAQAQQQFAQQLAAGNISARDRFGSPITKGSIIIWDANQQVVWEVVDVAPVLDPSAPPGAVDVQVRAAGHFRVLANNLYPQAIKVLQKPDEAPAAADTSEADPRD